jgi:hypothetical protein
LTGCHFLGLLPSPHPGLIWLIFHQSFLTKSLWAFSHLSCI